MKNTVIPALRRALALALLLGCTDAELPSAPKAEPGAARLAVAARPADDAPRVTTLPINRIRITARDASTNAVLGTATEDVAPGQDSWTLGINLELHGSTQVNVQVELINVASDGTTAVQWSGQVGPLAVSPGQTSAVQEVALYPGPLDNLSVTSLDIVGSTLPLTIGEHRDFHADVQGASSGVRVLWTTTAPTLVSLEPLSGTSVRVRGLAAGTATLTATAGAFTDEVAFGVRPPLAAIRITPDPATFDAIGQEIQLAAEGLDGAGNGLGPVVVRWESLQPAIAAHTGDGRFRSAAAGETHARAVAVDNPALTATSALIVRPKARTVRVRPDTVRLDAFGARAQLEIEATDANGNVIRGATGAWTSADPAIATVDAGGAVTAVANGTVAIGAAVDGAAGSATVIVAQKVASIDVHPIVSTLTALGETVQLEATPRDANRNIVGGRTLAWESKNPEIARVDGSGLVTALKTGTARIAAKTDGVEGFADVVVNQTIAEIRITGVPDSLAVGAAAQLGAHAVDANGNTVSGSPTWASANPGIATVSSTGLVTGVNAGTARITATINGYTGGRDVRVVGTGGAGGERTFLRVAAIGGNYGYQAASLVFQSGRLPGTIVRYCDYTYTGCEKTTAEFNAMSVAELLAAYDVLLFTWASSTAVNADWETRLKPFLAGGGGVLWEDDVNVQTDLAAIVTAGYYGSYTEDVAWRFTNVPGLTDGLTTDLVNNHIVFSSWVDGFTPFLYYYGAVAGLYAEFAGGGRIVLTGPDQDYHAHPEYDTNQYNFLVNELRWAGRLSAAAASAAAAPLAPALNRVGPGGERPAEPAQRQEKVVRRSGR